MKLSSFSQQASPGQTEEPGTVDWPQLPPAHRLFQPLHFPTFIMPSSKTVRRARNSPKTNDRTITINVSRSRLDKRSANQIKDIMTNVMQAQAETKECRIQYVRVLPREKIELCMESNSQYKDARSHSK